MAPYSSFRSSPITVTSDERDRVLLNPMVVLAREHMRQCGFTEEDVQRGSVMRTVGPDPGPRATDARAAADARVRADAHRNGATEPRARSQVAIGSAAAWPR